jgi:hypothetical protein
MGALALTSVPAPESRWADHVYTCTYRLPMGSLVLSVAVAPSDAAAADQLQAMRRQDGATAAEPGLGQQAFSAPNGTILAAKDNMVLRVDASGLPDRLGPTHEPRIGLTRILAAAVFNCWTGE